MTQISSTLTHVLQCHPEDVLSTLQNMDFSRKYAQEKPLARAPLSARCSYPLKKQEQIRNSFDVMLPHLLGNGQKTTNCPLLNSVHCLE